MMKTSFQPNGALPRTGSLASKTVSITITKPLDIGLADWMSHLRDWLDQHGIEPAGFKHNGTASGNQKYEVSFFDRNQADLFAAEFNKRHGQQQTPTPDSPT